MTSPFVTFSEVISFGALLVALSMFLFNLSGRKREKWKETRMEWEGKYKNLLNDHSTVVNWITSLEKDVFVLKTQMDIFWKGVGFTSAQALHSPHTPELDRLIEAFRQETIDGAGLQEFKQRLRAILMDRDSTIGQRKAARETLLAIFVQYDLMETLPVVTSGSFDIKKILAGIDTLDLPQLPP